MVMLNSKNTVEEKGKGSYLEIVTNNQNITKMQIPKRMEMRGQDSSSLYRNHKYQEWVLCYLLKEK